MVKAVVCGTEYMAPAAADHCIYCKITFLNVILLHYKTIQHDPLLRSLLIRAILRLPRILG